MYLMIPIEVAMTTIQIELPDLAVLDASQLQMLSGALWAGCWVVVCGRVRVRSAEIKDMCASHREDSP